MLELTQNANAETPLRLACVGLGNALNLCNGFANDPEVQAAFANFEGQLKLQGPHQLVEEQAPRLKEMLATKGMAESAWQLPVFLCEQLTGPKILPVSAQLARVRRSRLRLHQQQRSMPRTP